MELPIADAPDDNKNVRQELFPFQVVSGWGRAKKEGEREKKTRED